MEHDTHTNRRSSSSMIGFFIVAAAVCAPSWSAAKAKCTSETGKELWDSGTKAYNLGKWDEAIKDWEAAYKRCADPELLFNLGQAHRKAGHAEEALTLYKAWLRESQDASDDDRALVQKQIADLEKLIADKKAASESPPDEARTSEGDKVDPPAAQRETPPPARPLAPRDVTPWYADRLGWTLTGAGVASLVVGGGFVMWSNGLEDDARSAPTENEAVALFDDAESNRTIGAVAIATGSALVVAGVVALLIHDEPSTTSQHPRAAIGVGPSKITIQWSF